MPLTQPGFQRSGSAVSRVCPLVRTLGGRAQVGISPPESSVPGTEEITVFVERLNLVPKCTQIPSLSPVSLPVRPGLAEASTWTMESLLRVRSELGQAAEEGTSL